MVSSPSSGSNAPIQLPHYATLIDSDPIDPLCDNSECDSEYSCYRSTMIERTAYLERLAAAVRRS